MRLRSALAPLLSLAVLGMSASGQDYGLGKEGVADSAGVKIHYVTAGEGPLVVLLHGFPDFWYTWRAQIPVLARRFQVVAIDQRGYNQSDRPDGVENYALEKLTGDVEAVIKHLGKDQEKVILVGHDWGGLVAWTLAMRKPERVDRLVVLNLPHPRGLFRELAHNADQRKASQYARDFQHPDAAKGLNPRALAAWVRDDAAREIYAKAFEQSSIEAMLNYYKANFPKEPYQEPPADAFPVVRCPTLMIHGLQDPALLPGALNDTWKWVDAEFTLVTIPRAGHFVQQDAADRVTEILAGWLPQAPNK